MVDHCPGSVLERQKGQVLLIVVLVMIVALTVGLSLISRSIVNLRTSTEEAESQKALSAAEAGIEQALIKQDTETITGTFSSGGSNIEYTTTVESVGGLTDSDKSFFVNGGNELAQDDGTDIWLTEYRQDASIFNDPLTDPATLTIYWGEDSAVPCNNAALEITTIVGPEATPFLRRVTADPCGPRRNSNHFNAAQAVQNQVTIDGQNTDFNYYVNVLVGGGLITRIIPIYHDARVGVKSTVNLPVQGKLISSTGEAGKTRRKISVFQGFPKIPAELFPYAIFSPE